jgi:ribonuclease VapC
MFVDASAVIAIIAQEDDWPDLARRLERVERVHLSPLAIWEATAGLVRKRRWSFEECEEMVREFATETGADLVAIDNEIGREALRAARLYGKGRHKAALNFGDCFAYACAKVLGVPLLFKGDDFALTDVRPA